jgi:hypothetical protein
MLLASVAKLLVPIPAKQGSIDSLREAGQLKVQVSREIQVIRKQNAF